MKLSEFFPRLKDLGEVRVIANNGTAVLEFNTVIDEVQLGKVSWNFARNGVEFHLYTGKARSLKLFYGDHPRFRRVGLIEFVDDAGETKMMIFLYGDAAADEDGPRARAMRQLVADFGENPTIEEESAAA